MTWTCRKDGKERKKISSLSYRLMIPRAMLSYARLSASARLGSALVTTPAKPGRYQSWTRAFLPSMVFKKNKKIRPVHKLFCILILMIQMTARNFTKSPEGPY